MSAKIAKTPICLAIIIGKNSNIGAEMKKKTYFNPTTKARRVTELLSH